MIHGGIEKRKVFRLDIKTPLCTELTISQLNNQAVRTGFSKVCVVNVSPIGLSFVSRLNFPTQSEIVYNFKTIILGIPFNVSGIIVWKRPFPNSAYKYGVSFLINEDELKRYVQLFNRLALLQKKSKDGLQNCSLCTNGEFPCD